MAKQGRFDLCAFCPDLCLDRCTVAKVTGSTTNSPWAKMNQGWLLERGGVAPTEDIARVLEGLIGLAGARTDDGGGNRRCLR